MSAGWLPHRRSPEQTWKGSTMNLIVWLPGLFLLGLATFGLLFAFIVGCERV
jgi:hypothetical protein